MMMNELEAAIETRHEQLVKLLDLTAQQEVAIDQGAMSELLRVLAEKSKLAASFVTLSQRLKHDIVSSTAPPEISTRHRLQNEECNVMHRELMARETECEASLVDVRGRLGDSLTRGESLTPVDGARDNGKMEKGPWDDGAFHAASQQARGAHAQHTRGDRLDLINGG